MSDPIQASLESALFFGALSILTLLWAFRKKFFSIPLKKEEISLKFSFVFFGFLIYFSLVIFITPFLIKILQMFRFRLSAIYIVSLSNCLTLFSVSICLYYFSKINDLQKDLCFVKKDSIAKDILTGLISWVIAVPIVLFTGQVLDLFILFVLKTKEVPQQLAVQFIKSTLKSPFSFTFAFISVIFLAPFVEELLFRGLLQTWLKKHLDYRIAILVSSISFSLFHFSKLQQIGNLSILGALFPLAFFLGFIYEKRRSLMAPMVLHATFNASSLVSLIFF